MARIPTTTTTATSSIATCKVVCLHGSVVLLALHCRRYPRFKNTVAQAVRSCRTQNVFDLLRWVSVQTSLRR
eukprot:scaffold40990_cov292-Skeletonema_marinoi.AAC.1